MTVNRPERIKDKREGQKRESVDIGVNSIKFGLKEVQQVVKKDHKASPLARKLQQAGRGGQTAYIGPDSMNEEKQY